MKKMLCLTTVVVAKPLKLRLRRLARMVELELALLKAFSFCTKFAIDNMLVVSATFTKEAT